MALVVVILMAVRKSHTRYKHHAKTTQKIPGTYFTVIHAGARLPNTC